MAKPAVDRLISRQGWLEPVGDVEQRVSQPLLRPLVRDLEPARERMLVRVPPVREHRDGHIVHVRPELVVEVAFNEVQRSAHYPGGVALRFARVKGYRPDKSASESDTIDAVRAFL